MRHCTYVGLVDLAGVGPPLGAGAVDDAAALDAGAGEPREEQPQPRAPGVPLRRLLRRHDRPLDLQANESLRLLVLKLKHMSIGHRLITWMIILALHGPMKVMAPTL